MKEKIVFLLVFLLTFNTFALAVCAETNDLNPPFMLLAQLPTAPSNLTATAVTSSQINLTWSDNSADETGFEIERHAGNGNFVKIALVEADNTVFSDADLSANTTYFYRIRSCNPHGNSEYSNVAYATTVVPPSAPSNLKATIISASRIDLSWKDNSSNETGFKIERSAGGGAFTQISTVAANKTSFSDTNISPNISYTYRLRAYINGINSEYSNEASIRATIPAAPTDLTVTVAVSSKSADLTWTDNSDNESGFAIERRKDGESFSQVATVEANTTTYSDSGLASNTTYYYRVRAYNAVGHSAYSSEAITATGIPSHPANLTASTISNTQITLSWIDNSYNETGFKIERKSEGGSYKQVATVGANTTTYPDTNLSPDRTYYYRVRAYNSLGNSLYSNEASARTTVLRAPSNLQAATVSSSQIALSWRDNSDNETGFKIERKKKGGSYTQIATVGENVTTYVNTGLSNNTTYYYRVRAYNSLGNSEYSSEASSTTGILPSAPKNLTAKTVSASQITLSWTDSSNNETGFKIERKREGGSYSQIATVDANTEKYSDTGLTANRVYYYRVRSYNAVGNSAYSNEVNSSTGSPSAPTSLIATPVSKDKIMLTWSDNSGNETGFKIERKTAGGSYSQIATVGPNTTVYANTGLSPGTRYYFRVRAYNSLGNSAYSNEVSATTAAAPRKTEIRLYIGKTVYYVNDQRKEMDTEPVIIHNRTLLPVRYIAEAIGAGVGWVQTEQKATVTLQDKVIELWIGENTARVNGKSMPIDPDDKNVKPVVLPPGRTMLPLRFISENLGCQVDWSSALQEVKVTY